MTIRIFDLTFLDHPFTWLNWLECLRRSIGISNLSIKCQEYIA
jgi:hypothetical protein